MVIRVRIRHVALILSLLPFVQASSASAATYGVQVEPYPAVVYPEPFSASPPSVAIGNFPGWDAFLIAPVAGRGTYSTERDPNTFVIDFSGLEFRFQAGLDDPYHSYLDAVMRLDGVAPGTLGRLGSFPGITFDLSGVTLVTSGGTLYTKNTVTWEDEELDLALEPLSFDLSNSSLTGDLGLLSYPDTTGLLWFDLDTLSGNIGGHGAIDISGPLSMDVFAIPEPGTAVLLGAGMIVLAMRRKPGDPLS